MATAELHCNSWRVLASDIFTTIYHLWYTVNHKNVTFYF